jgi:hypothetical protein
LIVKIGAQDAEIQKALESVGQKSRSVDADLKKLGNSPIADQAKKSFDELTATIKGVTDAQQRLADRGKLAAQGLEALGGPARLTRTELDQVNKTIQSSLDAFRALGKQAPSELQKVADAITKQQKVLQSSSIAPASGGGKQLAETALGSLPGGNVLSAFGVGGVSAGIAAGATAGAAALGVAAKHALDYADALTKASDRTGIGVVALQRLEAIALASGNTLDDVTNAVNQFQKRLSTGDARAALDRIGLSITSIRALAPDDQFIAIAKAIQTIHDPAEQTRIAMELFGKSGAQLLPSLKADVVALGDSTFKMSADSVKALDALGDAFKAAETSALNLFGEVVAGAVRSVSAIAELPRILKSLPQSQPTGPPGSVRVVKAPGFQFGDAGPQGGGPTGPTLFPSSVFTEFADARFRRGQQLPPRPALPQTAAAAPITVPTGDSFERVVKDLERQRDAFNTTHAAEIKYIEALKAVDEKLRLAQLPIQSLTSVQGKEILALKALGLSNDEIAIKLGKSKTTIEDFARQQKFAADAAELTAKKFGTLRAVIPTLSGSAAALANVIAGLTEDGLLPADDTVSKFNKHLLTLSDTTGAVTGHMKLFRSEQEQAREELAKNAGNVRDLAEAFTRLSQTSTGVFHGVIAGAASAVNGMDALQQSAHSLQSGFAALPHLDENGEITGSLSKGLLGITTGAIGLVGTFLSVAKAIQQVFENLELGRIGHDVGRDFGVAVSQGTVEAIRQSERDISHELAAAAVGPGVPDAIAEQIFDPKKFREAASSLNLSSIIKDAGGVQGFGIEKTETELKKLFSLMQRGQLTVQQVGKTFDDVFAQLVPQALSKVSGLADKQFVDLQKLAIDSKISSPAVDQFRQQQVSQVTGGLGRFVGAGTSAQHGVAESQSQLTDLRAKLPGASPEDQAAIQKDIDSTSDKLRKQQALLSAVSISTQSAAAGMAGAVIASFGELQRQGVPITEIFKDLGPTIDDLSAQFQRAGLDGGSAFGQIQSLAALASDEVAGPALDAVSGLQQVLAGLSNTGLLTQDTFAGLSGQITSTFDSLVAQGKNGDDAIRLMQPSLQTIFELQEKFGFKVDDATQALLDQAEAAGVVGDKQKPIQQQQLDAANKTVDALDRIVTALERLTPAAKTAADGITGELAKIRTPDLTVRARVITDGTVGPNGAATGGLVTAFGIQHFADGGRVLPFLRRGTDTVPAMLTPGELVLNKDQQEAVRAALRPTVASLSTRALEGKFDDLAGRLDRHNLDLPRRLARAVRDMRQVS